MPAVAVAASGGRDSTALLHATARAAAVLGVQVHALHVHHGLVASADDWLAQVRRQCGRWGVAFHATRLRAAPAAGDSIEAWARRERYNALAAMARAAGCDLVLLAQHRRDQAETLLLQALRGGGPAGLSAMPTSAVRDGITWARPWLEQPREAIEAYVRRHRLAFVDDDSNADMRFARNRLRAVVWPVLNAAFPDAESQLQAAAWRAQEAAACLDELAAADLDAVLRDGGIDVARWHGYSAPRRSLLLRHWLRRHGSAPESLVRRLTLEMSGATGGACWPAPDGTLRLHDGRLRFDGVSVAGARRAVVTCPLTLDLSLSGSHEVVPWRGRILVEPMAAGGVALEHLRAVDLRSRRGGEQFQSAPRGVPRSLKKQYQQQRIPAWQRDGPLLWAGGALLFVPGLGIDARMRAPAGVPQHGLRWQRS